MAKAITSEKIKIRNARLSFARLDKGKPFAVGMTPKFQAAFLLDPSDKDHAVVIADIKAKAMKLLQDGGLTPADLTHPNCFGNGDKKKYDGYAGRFYVASSQETRPPVANRSAKPVQAGEKEFPYSGCFVNGSVTLWLQNNQYGKRINANLLAVQFVGDGPAFGGGAPVDLDDEFEALGDSPATAGSAPAGKDPFDD